MHGALLDSEILADVYLSMTGGQTDLMLGSETSPNRSETALDRRRITDLQAYELKVVVATDEELAAHQVKLEAVAQASGHECSW